MVGEVIAERYRLDELVGTGGMSSVFRAHDTMLERDVALKILHPHYTRDAEYVERFRREARAAAQIAHPNVVTVIDRGEHEGRQFIVFEYIPGENLKEVVERRGPLAVREAIDLALQVARGLAYAHEQGLVHRDVKPQNVLLNGDGRAKVTDFGIARSLDVVAGSGMTQPGTMLGTSHYIAPEQARGEGVDAQSDVYSLGCVLYELLTGDVPYRGESFLVVAMRHTNDPVPSVLDRRPDVPVRVSMAVERAMAKDPARRFPSMDAFAAELEACRAELARPEEERTMVVPARVRHEPRVRRRRARRNVWPVVTVLVLAAAAGVGFVAADLIRSSDDGDPRGDAQRGGAARPVRLAGFAAHDPFGGDGEHDAEAREATDGDPATSWTTESYRAGLQKQGVGLILDARRLVRLRSLTVTTDTPGFTAEIRAGESTSSFRPVSAPKTVAGTTRFPIRGGSARYYVVWITELAGSSAHVNEVRAAT